MIYDIVPWNDPTLNIQEGHVFAEGDPFPPNVPGLFPKDPNPPIFLPSGTLQPQERNGMGYFLFWIMYSTQGRRICRVNKAGREELARKPEDTVKPDGSIVNDAYYGDAAIRANLGQYFSQVINPLNSPTRLPVVDAALDCHISAGHITYWREQLTNVQNGIPFERRKGIVQIPTQAEILENVKKCSRDYQGALFLITDSLWEDFVNHDFDVTW
jgi:hypothetical protein